MIFSYYLMLCSKILFTITTRIISSGKIKKSPKNYLLVILTCTRQGCRQVMYKTNQAGQPADYAGRINLTAVACECVGVHPEAPAGHSISRPGPGAVYRNARKVDGLRFLCWSVQKHDFKTRQIMTASVSFFSDTV